MRGRIAAQPRVWYVRLMRILRRGATRDHGTTVVAEADGIDFHVIQSESEGSVMSVTLGNREASGSTHTYLVEFSAEDVAKILAVAQKTAP